MTQATGRPKVELLTREGCTICARAYARLVNWPESWTSTIATTDVDAAAAAGNPGLRAEFGDRLPVILLDGREHSYWEIDEPRLRADLACALTLRAQSLVRADSLFGSPPNKPLT